MYISTNPKSNMLQVSDFGKWPSIFEIPLNFGPWLMSIVFLKSQIEILKSERASTAFTCPYPKNQQKHASWATEIRT